MPGSILMKYRGVTVIVSLLVLYSYRMAEEEEEDFMPQLAPDDAAVVPAGLSTASAPHVTQLTATNSTQRSGGGAKRFRWRLDTDDVTLLCHIVQRETYLAQDRHIRASWVTTASEVSTGIGKEVSWRVCQDRFNLLLTCFREQRIDSMRQADATPQSMNSKLYYLKIAADALDERAAASATLFQEERMRGEELRAFAMGVNHFVACLNIFYLRKFRISYKSRCTITT